MFFSTARVDEGRRVIDVFSLLPTPPHLFRLMKTTKLVVKVMKVHMLKYTRLQDKAYIVRRIFSLRSKSFVKEVAIKLYVIFFLLFAICDRYFIIFFSCPTWKQQPIRTGWVIKVGAVLYPRGLISNNPLFSATSVFFEFWAQPCNIYLKKGSVPFQDNLLMVCSNENVRRRKRNGLVFELRLIATVPLNSSIPWSYQGFRVTWLCHDWCIYLWRKINMATDILGWKIVTNRSFKSLLPHCSLVVCFIF